jgi:hypothetical protein
MAEIEFTATEQARKLSARPEYVLGLIPEFFDTTDPRPAAQQVSAEYVSGWRPIPGFSLDAETLVLRYPGDEPMPPLFVGRLRDERIVVYESAFVAIVQKDGSFSVSRLD